jgi:anti-anti-sigma factor
MIHPRLDSTIHFVNGACELVRGREQEFIDELQPLVRSQSVRLDLSKIERIDAAGLAALISLCRDACKAGHGFTVVNPSRPVARMLVLVGLDRIVVLKDSGERLPPAPLLDLAGA